MKKEAKIRKMLGENYHLHSDNEGNWKLFRWYENNDLYFSEHNKVIMTSETHTEKDLLKFAKKNYVYDFERLHIRKALVMSIVCLIFCIVIIFFKNTFLRGIFYGMEVYLWVDLIVNLIAFNNNSKIRIKRLNEEIELRKRVIADKLSKNKIESFDIN